MLSQADLQVRRLRYFLNLLSTGYRLALRPDPLPGSLRSERIALGIDRPELDAVPLWSVQRNDGAISIPFVEFIVGEAGRALEAFGRQWGSAPVHGSGELHAALVALDEAIAGSAGVAGRPRAAHPEMRDLFVPGALLEPLCGPGGLVDRIEHGFGDPLPVRPERHGI